MRHDIYNIALLVHPIGDIYVLFVAMTPIVDRGAYSGVSYGNAYVRGHPVWLLSQGTYVYTVHSNGNDHEFQSRMAVTNSSGLWCLSDIEVR